MPWRVHVFDGRLTYLVYTGADQLYAARPVADAPRGVDVRRRARRGGPIRVRCSRAAPSSTRSSWTTARSSGRADWRGRATGVRRSSVAASTTRRRGSDASTRGSSTRHACSASGDRVLMIARRHLRGDGRFDHGRTWLPPSLRTRVEQAAYSATRKRSALWEIDPDSLAVTWLADLPEPGRHVVRRGPAGFDRRARSSSSTTRRPSTVPTRRGSAASSDRPRSSPARCASDDRPSRPDAPSASSCGRGDPRTASRSPRSTPTRSSWSTSARR